MRVVEVDDLHEASWTVGVVAAMRVGKMHRQWALCPPTIAFSESNGKEARGRVRKCCIVLLPAAKQLVIAYLRLIIVPCVCLLRKRKTCVRRGMCVTQKEGAEARAHAHAERHTWKHDEMDRDEVLGARPKRQGQAVDRKAEAHM